MQKMSKEDFLNLLKKNKNLKLDLENGIVLDLKYDKDLKAYKSYVDDLDMGIWKIKTLYRIVTEDWGCNLVLEEK